MNSLPDEMIMEIYLKCNLDSIKRLRQTNKRIYEIGIDPRIDDNIKGRFDEAIYLFFRIACHGSQIIIDKIRYRISITISRDFVKHKSNFTYRIIPQRPPSIDISDHIENLPDFIEYYISTHIELCLPFQIIYTFNLHNMNKSSYDCIDRFLSNICRVNMNDKKPNNNNIIDFNFNVINVEKLLIRIIDYYGIMGFDQYESDF